MRKVLIGLVQVYRFLISPIIPPACRFHPSCSRYAVDAIQRHGAVRGFGLALLRIFRCHPFHQGGYDPVK